MEKSSERNTQELKRSRQDFSESEDHDDLTEDECDTEEEDSEDDEDDEEENDSIVQSDDEVILKEDEDAPSESSDPEQQKKYLDFLTKEAAKITGNLEVREVAGRCLRARTKPRIDKLKEEAEAFIAEDHKKKHISILRKMQKDFANKPEGVNIVWPKFTKQTPYETVRSEFKRITALLDIEVSDSEDESEDEEEVEDDDDDYEEDEETVVNSESSDESVESDSDLSTKSENV
jgi:hypothetical protein